MGTWQVTRDTRKQKKAGAGFSDALERRSKERRIQLEMQYVVTYEQAASDIVKNTAVTAVLTYAWSSFSLCSERMRS